MAQDYSFMQNQFSLVEGHRGIKCRGVERKRAPWRTVARSPEVNPRTEGPWLL